MKIAVYGGGCASCKKLYENAIVLQKALEKNQIEDIDHLYPEFERLMKMSRNEIQFIIQEHYKLI